MDSIPLDFGSAFLILVAVFMALAGLTIAHLILAITWIVQAATGEVPARGLFIYALLFLPALFVAFYDYWWPGVCTFLLSAPFLLAVVLIFNGNAKRDNTIKIKNDPSLQKQAHNQTNFK